MTCVPAGSGMAAPQSAPHRGLARGLGSHDARLRRRVLLVHLALQLVSGARAFSMPAATAAGTARMAFSAPAATAGFSSFARASFKRRAYSPAAPPAFDVGHASLRDLMSRSDGLQRSDPFSLRMAEGEARGQTKLSHPTLRQHLHDDPDGPMRAQFMSAYTAIGRKGANAKIGTRGAGYQNGYQGGESSISSIWNNDGTPLDTMGHENADKAAAPRMRLEKRQPAARTGTLKDDLPALKALKAFLRDDAAGSKAVDASSSGVFIPQDMCGGLRLKHAVDDSDGDASNVPDYETTGVASIERDLKSRFQIGSAEEVGTEKPMETVACRQRLGNPAFRFPRLQAAIFSIVGNAIAALVSMGKPLLTLSCYSKKAAHRGWERLIWTSKRIERWSKNQLCAADEFVKSCREASRREADRAYNAITFAFPHVFYPPKIYPAGTRGARRQQLRAAYLTLSSQERNDLRYQMAEMRLQAEMQDRECSVEVDLAATNPRLPLATRVTMARRTALAKEVELENAKLTERERANAMQLEMELERAKASLRDAEGSRIAKSQEFVLASALSDATTGMLDLAKSMKFFLEWQQWVTRVIKRHVLEMYGSAGRHEEDGDAIQKTSELLKLNYSLMRLGAVHTATTHSCPGIRSIVSSKDRNSLMPMHLKAPKYRSPLKITGTFVQPFTSHGRYSTRRAHSSVRSTSSQQ